MITTTVKTIPTKKGSAEGVKVQWDTLSLLLITAPKGVLACGIFDIDALNRYGSAAALVEGSPDNPIGTIERMMTRTVSSANQYARGLGITTGMPVQEALELLF